MKRLLARRYLLVHCRIIIVLNYDFTVEHLCLFLVFCSFLLDEQCLGFSSVLIFFCILIWIHLTISSRPLLLLDFYQSWGSLLFMFRFQCYIFIFDLGNQCFHVPIFLPTLLKLCLSKYSVSHLTIFVWFCLFFIYLISPNIVIRTIYMYNPSTFQKNYYT